VVDIGMIYAAKIVVISYQISFRVIKGQKTIEHFAYKVDHHRFSGIACECEIIREVLEAKTAHSIVLIKITGHRTIVGDLRNRPTGGYRFICHQSKQVFTGLVDIVRGNLHGIDAIHRKRVYNRGM